MDDEGASLLREIAELQRAVEEARTELYATQLKYAAQHFHTQSLMQANSIERLHRSGAAAEAEVIERRCRQLEAAIAQHKRMLAKLEPGNH